MTVWLFVLCVILSIVTLVSVMMLCSVVWALIDRESAEVMRKQWIGKIESIEE